MFDVIRVTVSPVIHMLDLYRLTLSINNVFLILVITIRLFYSIDAGGTFCIPIIMTHLALCVLHDIIDGVLLAWVFSCFFILLRSVYCYSTHPTIFRHHTNIFNKLLSPALTLSLSFFLAIFVACLLLVPRYHAPVPVNKILKSIATRFKNVLCRCRSVQYHRVKKSALVLLRMWHTMHISTYFLAFSLSFSLSRFSLVLLTII